LAITWTASSMFTLSIKSLQNGGAAESRRPPRKPVRVPFCPLGNKRGVMTFHLAKERKIIRLYDQFGNRSDGNRTRPLRHFN
jgi:hypothetical protein